MTLENNINNFADLAKIWYKKNTIRVSYSYKNNLLCMIKHLNNYLGEMPLQNIKPYHIDNIITELAIMNPTTHKPTSKKTLKELVHIVFRIFELAVDNDLILKNPAKNKCKEIPKNSSKNEVTSIPKDVQILILSTPHRCQIAALIMMLSGLRASEMLALEWDDINFENKTIYVKQHAVKSGYNKYEIKYATKNKKTRYVTMPDNLCAFLYVQKLKATTKLVFTKKDGSLHTPTSWRSAWKSYMNTLNYYNNGCIGSKFDPKGYPKTIKVNPHQLRHTYATLLYVSGTDVLTASKLLGHSSVQITLDIYTHLEEEYKTLDISNFNEYLSTDLCKI